MTLHAITVLGHDRPGIIAETTRSLAELGLNIEDTSMTRLRAHFAMTLICAGTVSREEIAAGLASLSGDGSLSVTVLEVPEEHLGGDRGSSWVLSVHGGDRPGIVSAIADVVAEAGGNITDLTTRLAGDLYVLIAEVDFAADVDASGVEARLREVATRMEVGVSLRPTDTDEL